jgi:hypothetical protein
MAHGHVYHWRHGWIPITPEAAEVKAHGDKSEAHKLLVNAEVAKVAAGEKKLAHAKQTINHAHGSAGKDLSALSDNQLKHEQLRAKDMHRFATGEEDKRAALKHHAEVQKELGARGLKTGRSATSMAERGKNHPDALRAGPPKSANDFRGKSNDELKAQLNKADPSERDAILKEIDSRISTGRISRFSADQLKREAPVFGEKGMPSEPKAKRKLQDLSDSELKTKKPAHEAAAEQISGAKKAASVKERTYTTQRGTKIRANKLEPGDLIKADNMDTGGSHENTKAHNAEFHRVVSAKLTQSGGAGKLKEIEVEHPKTGKRSTIIASPNSTFHFGGTAEPRGNQMDLRAATEKASRATPSERAKAMSDLELAAELKKSSNGPNMRRILQAESDRRAASRPDHPTGKLAEKPNTGTSQEPRVGQGSGKDPAKLSDAELQSELESALGSGMSQKRYDALKAERTRRREASNPFAKKPEHVRAAEQFAGAKAEADRRRAAQSEGHNPFKAVAEGDATKAEVSQLSDEQLKAEQTRLRSSFAATMMPSGERRLRAVEDELAARKNKTSLNSPSPKQTHAERQRDEFIAKHQGKSPAQLQKAHDSLEKKYQALSDRYDAAKGRRRGLLQSQQEMKIHNQMKDVTAEQGVLSDMMAGRISTTGAGSVKSGEKLAKAASAEPKAASANYGFKPGESIAARRERLRNEASPTQPKKVVGAPGGYQLMESGQKTLAGKRVFNMHDSSGKLVGTIEERGPGQFVSREAGGPGGRRFIGKNRKEAAALLAQSLKGK